jgi:hypothetical protein
MPKYNSKFTEDFMKEYTCFCRGDGKFEAECMMCVPRTFVSVANKGL